MPQRSRPIVQLFEVDGRGGIIDSIVAAGDFGLWQKQTRSFEQMAILGWTVYDLSGKMVSCRAR